MRSLVISSCLAGALSVVAMPSSYAGEELARANAEIRLGRRLFEDGRFSTPAGDFVTSCRDCHLFNESPEGLRAFTDFLGHSWQPWRSEDPLRDTLRNAPTLLDVADASPLHYDGEFGSLEELVKGTLTGRPMGWLPAERNQAALWARSIINKDDREVDSDDSSYSTQLQQVYGVDSSELPAETVVELVARAVSAYVRTLKSPRNSPYDRFVALNGLDPGPVADQSVDEFARAQVDKVTALEASQRLELPTGFDRDALAGWKRFLSVGAAASNGNCVSCHVPPNFTDGRFHNIGISQREYESLHGPGTFATFDVPDASAAIRPDARYRRTPSRGKPNHADLGHWNHVDLQRSPARRTGETDSQFLERMLGTFKTPTLRNLAYSHPYYHNGSTSSLEGALLELVELSRLAREGQLRAVADELKSTRITTADVPYLVAFLRALTDDWRAETLSPR